MNHHMLYASNCGMPQLLPWQTELTSRGIVVLRVGRLEDGTSYCTSYPLLMILLDIFEIDESFLESAAKLKTAQPSNYVQAPLIGIAHKPISEAEMARLAAAGFDDIVCKDAPDQFMLWKLGTLLALQNLKQFEQSRMDVANLAHRTRERLHDLSQPLSAVQGRLQLMAARLRQDDPNAEQLNDLVKLIFEVSQQVMEIHHLHRQYS